MMESLTDDLIYAATDLIQEIEEMGGMTKAIESGWAKLKIEEAATKKQSRIDSVQETIVGVNKFRLDQEEDVDVLQIDNTAVRKAQTTKLARLKETRNSEDVNRALTRLSDAASSASGKPRQCTPAAAMRGRV